MRKALNFSAFWRSCGLLLGFGAGTLSLAQTTPVVGGKDTLPQIEIGDEVAGNLKKESTPTPTRPKVASASSNSSDGILGSLSFGRLASSTSDPKVRLEVINRLGHTVPDPRSDTAVRESSGTDAASGLVAVKTHEFDLRLRFFEETDMKVSSIFRLPIRSANVEGPTLETSGTEVGGYDVGVEIRMAAHLMLEALYSDRRSTELGLHDAHSDFLAAFTYTNARINPDRGFAIQARLGAEITTPMGQSTISDRVAIDRGTGWGIRARLGGRMEFSPAADFRMGSEGYFGRTGGAGTLFTVEPYLEYGMSEFLNFRLSAAFPLVRPEGNEGQFSRPELPGLYGRSVGLTVAVGFL